MTTLNPQVEGQRPTAGRIRSALALALCLWSFLFLTYPGSPFLAADSGPEAHEYELKAAFVYKFARYASWPKGTFKKDDSPLIIAVVGKDPFGRKLEAVIKGRKVGKHPVIIRRYAAAADIKEVHLAILGELPKKERAAAIKKLNAAGSLVVADKGGTESTGASIGFAVKGKRIRFEIHVRHLKASKVRISSQLLKLAEIVGRTKKKS